MLYGCMCCLFKIWDHFKLCQTCRNAKESIKHSIKYTNQVSISYNWAISGELCMEKEYSVTSDLRYPHEISAVAVYLNMQHRCRRRKSIPMTIITWQLLSICIQGDKISASWHLADVMSSHSPWVWCVFSRQ